MSEQIDRLKIVRNKHSHSITGEVRSIQFLNDGYQVVYIPSLKLSAYGSSLTEARKMMSEVVVPDWCENLLNLKESPIISILRDLGFRRESLFSRELSQTAHVDTQGILKDFELSEDTVVTEEMMTV